MDLVAQKDKCFHLTVEKAKGFAVITSLSTFYIHYYLPRMLHVLQHS